MTSAGNGISIASTDTRASKSWKSRVGSLFNPKGAHVNEPVIDLEEPWREYTRGDEVKGKVILDVTRPLGITHITISLFGYLEVFKHHSRGQTGLRTNPVRVASGKGKRWVTEYYGDGFASLFEDELPLCGEGRLDPNVYHFKFAMPFPSDRDLPTGIEFERGVVAYGVAVTVTRPTTIAPTTTVTRSIKYKQTIDVAKLPPPKPQLVTSKPVSTSTRTKVVRRLTSTSGVDDRCGSRLSSKSKPDSQRQSNAAIPSAIESGMRSPTSPVPSAQSTLSVSSAGRRESGSPSEPHASQSSQDAATVSQGSSEKKTITATIELSKSGVMPGDVLPLHIHIQHTKSIRTPVGVIVTLYRQARTDMHPNLPIAPQQASGRSKRSQDYYPKSKSGLGGLSLAAAGSSQVWRKDLCQSISPLYVDDQTMTAVLRPVIRVPTDNMFPTISNAPGDMIMFKYFVEVLIDLQGKWPAGSVVPDMSSTAPTSVTVNNSDGRIDETRANEQGAFYYPSVSRGASRTHHEVVIGTHDSDKQKGKGREVTDSIPADPEQSSPAAAPDANGDDQGHTEPEDPAWQYSKGYDPHYYDPRFYDPRYYDYYNNNNYDPDYAYWQYQEPPWNYSQVYPPVPPPPNIPDDSDLSEKERIRRAEQTLLPSRPSGADETQAASGSAAPSAPYLPEDDQYSPSAPAYSAAGASGQLHPPFAPDPAPSNSAPQDRVNSVRDGQPHDRPAPSYSVAMDRGSSSTVTGDHSIATDDKQELERRRLQADASAPDAASAGDIVDGEASKASAPPVGAIGDMQTRPSAPPETASAPTAQELDGADGITANSATYLNHEPIIDHEDLETDNTPMANGKASASAERALPRR